MSGVYFKLVIFLVTGGFCYAQEYRGTFLGEVQDPSGTPIPKARVVITKQDTGVSRETVTNDRGYYTVTALDPGTYTVAFSAEGFQTQRRPNLVLRTADKLNLTVKLELGAVAQEVTVLAQQELINTATASRGLVIDPIKVTEIPLNGRQSYMLMNLVPGVRFTQRQFGSSGFSGTRAWDVNGSFTMNGGRTGTNQFLLNGAPISTNGTFNLAPNVEAIQEFKVMVNTYDAQFGRSGGGHVNTTLKAGTNQWHGSLFDFWRNRILDANARQNNAGGQPRGFRNQHQFGGVIGGPIRENRDFVFFSFEGWQERTPFPVVSTVPPSALREGQNFSSFGVRIHDPMTSRPCTAEINCITGGVFQRQPFPGNVIPASRISPVARNILRLYPTENFVGPNPLSQNFLRPDVVGRYRYEQPMARYDRVVNDNNRFHFVFTFQDGSEFRDQNGFDPPARTGNMISVRRDMNYIANWQTVLSPTKLLTIQTSFNRFAQNFPDVSDYEFTWDKLGIRNIPQVATFPSRLAPRVELDGFNAILGNQFRNYINRQQLNVQGGLAQTLGRHSLKYGAEWAMLLRANSVSGRPTGLMNFNRGWTQQYAGLSQGALDGSSVASLLLGHMNSGSINYNDTFFRREPYVAGYFQDDWRILDRLTLNIGLRYDVQFPFIEIHDRLIGGFDFNTRNPVSDEVLTNWRRIAATRADYPPAPSQLSGGLLFANTGGLPRRVYKFDFSNLQPRIGFAYRWGRRTAIRGGFGIFHRTATQDGPTTGYSQSTPFIGTLTAGQFPSASGVSGPYSLEDPWPGGVLAPEGSRLGLLTNIGRDANFDSRNRLIPRTFQFSFGLEREFFWGMLLEVSYVGSRTVKEPLTIQMARPREEIYLAARANPTFFQARVPNPFFGVLPTGVARGASPEISRFDLYSRIPQFTGVEQALMPWGRSWYNGLQVKFERRFLPNSRYGTLTWVANYTFSKQMERFTRENFTFEFRSVEFFGSQLTDIDVRHQLTMAGVYDLPVGRGRPWLNRMHPAAEALAGGWNVNLWLDWNSGVPTGLNTGWDFSCGSYVNPNQNELAWFENRRQCYTQRLPFTFRQLPARHGNITDPTAVQVNLALAKKIRFSERWSIELRGEAFNAFNTPIRQGPNTDPNSNQFGILPVAQFNFPRNVQIGARVRF